MKSIKYILFLIFSVITLSLFSQTKSEDPNAVLTEWESISLGKLQKKPRFKDPMISVRFMYENGVQYLHLSLKYMFTDAVFEEAVPVEYYKDQKIQFVTNKGKFELKSAKYAKARRMNSVAQKTADLKVLFVGDLSFLKDNLTKSFIVHYAQGYQDIDLNSEESIHMKDAYNKFLAMLPSSPAQTKAKATGKPKEIVEPKTETPTTKTNNVEDSQSSLDKLRRQAKKWK